MHGKSASIRQADMEPECKAASYFPEPLTGFANVLNKLV
jgi:hypothetical protein